MKFDNKYISIGVFLAFSIKFLILSDLNAWNAFYLLVCAGFVAFYEYKITNKQLVQHVEQIEKLRKEVEDLKNIQKDIVGNISSIKVAQNMKTQNFKF